MDAMMLAQLWMGTSLVLMGLSWAAVKSMSAWLGWAVLLLGAVSIVLGVLFAIESGYWPLILIPASGLYYLVWSVSKAWSEALKNVKDAE